MIVSNTFQLKSAMIMALFGLIAGLIYSITHLKMGIFRNKIYLIVADTLSTISASIILIIGVHLLNYGIYRVYMIAFFVIGYTLEVLTIGKLFAKMFCFVYNHSCSMVNFVRNTQVYRFIFR